MNFSEITNINIPEGVVSKITTLDGIVLWVKKGVEPDIPDLPTPLANQIYYTTSDGNIIELSSDYSGVQPISNTYKNGVGKMVFENNLTEIGNHAFYKRTSLQSIELPEGVTTISGYAFFGCSSLQSIVIPESVTSIGDWAFRNCSSLQSIELPSTLTTINTNAFYNCSSLKSVVIPEGVTTISGYAFQKCSSLQSVELPSTLTTIYVSAFQACSSLKSIVIPEGVTFIDDYAFDDCSSLQSIELPSTLKTIGTLAFYNCSSLYSITCKPMTAPTLYDDVFDYVGTKVPDGTPKVLRVPEGSTGYKTWLSKLEGFELQYITE